MRKLRLDCDLPGTSPGWPSYHFDSMHSTDSAHAHAPKFFEDPNMLLNIQQSKQSKDRMQKKGQVRPVRQRRARFRAQAQKVKNMYATAIYMRQKSTNKSRCEFHRVLSNAAFLQCPGFSYRQYASSFESQVFRGRPTRRVPKGCQESKR